MYSNSFVTVDLETAIMQSINVHSSIVNLSSDNMLNLKKPKIKLQVSANSNIRGITYIIPFIFRIHGRFRIILFMC